MFEVDVKNVTAEEKEDLLGLFSWILQFWSLPLPSF